jgi:hypothetical protein
MTTEVIAAASRSSKSNPIRVGCGAPGGGGGNEFFFLAMGSPPRNILQIFQPVSTAAN